MHVDMLEVMVLIYPLYGVPAIVGCAIAWGSAWGAWGQRPRLRICDWLLPVLPFVVWVGTEFVHPLGKTLSNLKELMALGVVVAVLFGLRIVLAHRAPHAVQRWSAGALFAGCMVALIFWGGVPALKV